MFDFTYSISNNTFLHDIKIGIGEFATISIGDKLSPSQSSAIDHNKRVLLIKIHQEFLERYRIGLNNKSLKEVTCQDIRRHILTNNKRETLGYGYNKVYGYMDTTGTASGIKGKIVKCKAILELLEKNEAMLLWYKGLGYSLKKDKYIQSLIKSIGFYSEDIYIFKSINLSNCSTYTVLCFQNKKIVASGISCNIDSYKALLNALYEAKLIETLFQYEEIGIYKNFTSRDYSEVYERVIFLCENLEECSFTNLNVKKIELVDWIQTLELGVLNISNCDKFITIRCFSKNLINSIPIKSNLKNETNQLILKKFKITWDTIKDLPDCVII